MSTAPNRRTKNDAVRAKANGPSRVRAGKASFAYGYRLVEKSVRGGEVDVEMVPLTLEDVLHPEFGDVHVLSDAHDDDCNYLKSVLKDRYAGDATVAVLSDCGIFWDVPGLRHHSPDLSVIFGVKKRKGWQTFDVREERTRPALIIEVTSPKTRVTDVKTKVQHYARARVRQYVIADAAEGRQGRRLRLISYALKGSRYTPVELDDQGRAWLEPVGLWLGVRENPSTGGDRLALVDAESDEEIGDYTAVNRARAAAEERAVAEAQRADLESEARAAAEYFAAAETQRAAAEARRADAAARAHAAALARIRELEARLRETRRRRKGT
jgi:hypothetical protein